MTATLKGIGKDLLINRLIASVLLPATLRARVMRWVGFTVADGVNIRPGCVFGGPEVEIGHGTFLNWNCFIDTLAPVRIGARCSIGMQTMICTGTHVIGGPAARAGELVGRSVSIGDGVWIGARVTILPGVSVGDGCVIAAGALVSSDCEPHGLYVGTPATRVRDLEA